MITTSEFCKNEYGEKLYKISFDAGFSCPNRDGTLHSRGCIFCSEGGSGDFAVRISNEPEAFEAAVEAAKKRVSAKYSGDKYIAYFQAFTNTYAPVEVLEDRFTRAISDPEVVCLSIATET